MGQSKRVLIVGAGSIGLKHLQAFGSLERRPHLAAIDPREEARARAAGLGAEILQADWDALELSDFDGVVVCAPAPMHVPYSVRCLREGVPVLSEKPLSHSWDRVDELLDIAGRGGAPPSGVAYVRRYHPAHERAQEFLASGQLGAVLETRVVAGQPFTRYRPDYRQIYYASREQGGGCLLDCASHFIDLLQWYMGPISCMRGFIRHLALEGVEVEDAVSVALDFRSGMLGTLHVNQYQPLNENRIEFCGADGILRLVEPDFTCQIWRRSLEQWEDLPTEPADYAEALRRQAAAFLAAIEGGPPMRTSFADGAHTLRLCLDLLESANDKS